jgi:hypothetical protein
MHQSLSSFPFFLNTVFRSTLNPIVHLMAAFAEAATGRECKRPPWLAPGKKARQLRLAAAPSQPRISKQLQNVSVALA